MSSTLAGEAYATKPQRRGRAWRLFQFFRFEKRRKQRPFSVAQAPPRLGPIGDGVLSFDNGDTFSPLKFDPNFTFDLSKTSLAPKSTLLPKSQPSNSPTQQLFSTSLDSPKSPPYDSFLDSWLSQAINVGKEETTSEPQSKKVKSTQDVEPATNTNSVIVPKESTSSSQTSTLVQRSQSFSASQAKPRIGEEAVPNSQLRSSGLPALADKRSVYGSNQPSAHSNSKYSVNETPTESATAASAPPAASKRFSTGSQHYTQPIKTVDSDTQSINSNVSVPNRRFEVKTVSLAAPKTDNSSVAVSHTISRINNNNSYTGIFGAPATVTPRSIDLPKRSVTDIIKPLQKPADRSPSRRTSSPAIRTSWAENSTPGSSRTPTPTRPGDRKDSGELAKNNGRDHVFGRLNGGVAAKLAAFEQKKEGDKVTSFPSRASSNASRVPIAEHEAPGKVDKMMGESFKRKLEGITGDIAQKLQEKNGALKVPTPPVEARKSLVPQDVLDMIDATGVDSEVAINDYLKHGPLGHTKSWDDGELRKAISDPELEKLMNGEDAKKSTAVTAVTAVLENPSVVLAAAKPVDITAPSKPPVIISQIERPVERSIPSPVVEDKLEEALQAVVTKKETSPTFGLPIITKPANIAAAVEVAPPAMDEKEATNLTVSPTCTEKEALSPVHIDDKDFNPAALPHLGS